MKYETPRATLWARRAGLTLMGGATCIYVCFFFIPPAETETLSDAAAVWGMVSAYLIGGILLFAPTK